MFKDNKRLASTTSTDTLIGQGTLCEGKMICEASLRIEGEYRGDIECKADVVIGECGTARSNIVARDVTVAGKVYGDIVTKGRLVITSSGQLTGTITAHTLIIQEGGRLSGNCHMEPAAEQGAPQIHSKESADKESKEKSRQAG